MRSVAIVSAMITRSTERVHMVASRPTGQPTDQPPTSTNGCFVCKASLVMPNRVNGNGQQAYSTDRQMGR